MYTITKPFRVILVLILLALYAVFRNTAALVHYFPGAYYGKIVLRVFNIRMITNINIHHIQKNIPGSIIIANHRTNMDIYAVLSLCLSSDPLWLSKKELKKYFVLPFMKRRWGLVFVDRTSGGNYDRIISEILRFPKNRPLIIFPEGGFNTNNNELHFKSGFARIAAQTGRHILPVAISGLDVLCPDPDYTPLRGGTFKLNIGKPFHVKNDSEQSIVTAVNRGRKEVKALLKK